MTNDFTHLNIHCFLFVCLFFNWGIVALRCCVSFCSQKKAQIKLSQYESHQERRREDNDLTNVAIFEMQERKTRVQLWPTSLDRDLV